MADTLASLQKHLEKHGLLVEGDETRDDLEEAHDYIHEALDAEGGK